MRRGGGGGVSEVLPRQTKGGGTKGFSHADGGGGAQKDLTQELEVLAVLIRGGGKKFPPFKRGGGAGKVLPCLEGGRKTFWACDFPIL